MQKYITQLLDDIKAGHRPEQDPEALYSDSSGSLEDHFADVERYLAGYYDEGDAVFSHYCGVRAEQFPPVDKLSEKEINTLCKALHKLFWTWNVTVDFPKNLPPMISYPLLVGVLDRKIRIVDSGFIGIEFCDYEVENCPHGTEYCECKDWE